MTGLVIESIIKRALMRTRDRRIFYGWWLLGAGVVATTLHGGLFTYGFAAFFVPLAADLGTSRGSLSVAFSFVRLESSLLGPIEGYLIDRFGPRRIMVVGYVIFAAGFLLFSRVHSLRAFYFAFALVALGGSLSGFLPVFTAVCNWFVRRRGVASGIAMSGINIGGVLVVVVALAITSFGWRTTAVGMAEAILLLGFPLAAMMRHRPQSHGFLPDGDPLDTPAPSSGPRGSEKQLGAAQVTRAGPAREHADFTPMQALRTSAFWLLALAHGFSLLMVGAVTIHEIPLLVDTGMTYETAAAILSLMTGFAIVGRIGGGFVGDKLGKKPTLIACFVMMAAGLVILGTTQSLAQAVLFAIPYGLGYGARGPMMVALRADYFGPRNFATIMGLSQPIMMIGSFIGPAAAGFAYDIQGSYAVVFTVIAVVGLTGAILVLFVRQPAPPRRREVMPTADG